MSSITIDNTTLIKLHLRLGLLTQAIFHQLQNCCINKGGGKFFKKNCGAALVQGRGITR